MGISDLFFRSFAVTAYSDFSIHAEDGGMVLYVKRLEEGTFRLPAYDSRSRSYPMEWRDLVMMVEGISDNPNERLKRLKASRKDGFY